MHFNPSRKLLLLYLDHRSESSWISFLSSEKGCHMEARRDGALGASACPWKMTTKCSSTNTDGQEAKATWDLENASF